jgi:type 1 glutamine amidotransferase
MTQRTHQPSIRRARIAPRGRLLLLLLGVCGTATRAVAQQTRPATGQAPATGGATAVRPIRALSVTGGGFHDFVAQERIVPPGIAARANVVWTVDHTAGTSTETLIARHQTTSWADEFDVVVYNMSFSFVVDPRWIERIAHAHRDRGVAAVLLHGATHSYRRSTTDAWRELMGAASMRHDAQREFRLERLAADHPIVKALPKEWGPGVDELYNIDRTWPSATPLVQAWSVEGEKHHPVVWTNTFGKARVFVTTMGHTNRTMSDPAYLDLVTRGLLWTLGKLEADGTPAAGYGPRPAAP